MQDEPTPQEVLTAVSTWMRNELLPVAPAGMAFHVRVAANAIDLALRQLAQGPGNAIAELARLQALQGMLEAQSGDLASLNAALANGLASGAVDGADPAVVEHLYATTLEKLAVDQPAYAAYRRAAGL